MHGVAGALCHGLLSQAKCQTWAGEVGARLMLRGIPLERLSGGHGSPGRFETGQVGRAYIQRGRAFQRGDGWGK